MHIERRLRLVEPTPRREHRTPNIERPIMMTLRFTYFLDKRITAKTWSIDHCLGRAQQSQILCRIISSFKFARAAQAPAPRVVQSL